MPRLRGEERNHTLGKARQHPKASRVHDWPSCFRLLHCLRVADCLTLGVYITGDNLACSRSRGDSAER
jgi:hypothetical protein